MRYRKIKKYGNSFVITLTMADIKDLGLSKGDLVDIEDIQIKKGGEEK